MDFKYYTDYEKLLADLGNLDDCLGVYDCVVLGDLGFAAIDSVYYFSLKNEIKARYRYIESIKTLKERLNRLNSPSIIDCIG